MREASCHLTFKRPVWADINPSPAHPSAKRASAAVSRCAKDRPERPAPCTYTFAFSSDYQQGERSNSQQCGWSEDVMVWRDQGKACTTAADSGE